MRALWVPAAGGIKLWEDEVAAQLFAYDAGTDSGVTYSSANLATEPPVTIARIQMSPFDVSEALGTFTFTRTGND